MDAAERAAAATAAGGAVVEVAHAVEGVHRAVLGRVRRGLGAVPAVSSLAAAPADAVDAATALTYRLVRAGARAAGGTAAVAVRMSTDASRTPWTATPQGTRAVAWLGSAFGDHLAADAGTAALAPAAAIRSRGRAVSGPALPQEFPGAAGTVVVLLHGLAGHELQWPDELGEAVRRAGGTPVAVRYTSGLPVAANGRALDRVLEDLVVHWPTPVTAIVVVGHSMGGLVARSALAQAEPEARWARLVTDLVTLGTPHGGAPLERVSHRALQLLERWETTAPLALLGHRRAHGIKDLRFGAVVPAHWGGRHPDEVGGRRADDPTWSVPLSDGVRHTAVVATIAADPAGIAAAAVGDGLVPPRSAEGREDGQAAARVVHLGGTGHLALQREPRVVALVGQIVKRAATTGAGEQPSAQVDLDHPDDSRA